MVFGRIDAGVFLEDHTAVIERGVDFARLFGAGHDMGFDRQSFGLAVDGSGDFFKMGRRVRAEKLAADIEVAGQFLLGDEILDEGEGVMPFGDNGAGGRGAMVRRQIVETEV